MLLKILQWNQQSEFILHKRRSLFLDNTSSKLFVTLFEKTNNY